ncbi:hypothetical protein BFL35_02860 [Clavibacter michiganensis]|nr:hypothetical protein BFL35_02860 [Clavibacter michiganensis]
MTGTRTTTAIHAGFGRPRMRVRGVREVSTMTKTVKNTITTARPINRRGISRW